MSRNQRRWRQLAWVPLLAGTLVMLPGCTGSGGGTTPATLTLKVGSTAAADAWATLGLTLVRVDLVRASGGTVAALTASDPLAGLIDVAHLDQAFRVLGQAQVPADAYSAVRVTFGDRPGEVVLAPAAAPKTPVDPRFISLQGDGAGPVDGQVVVELALDPDQALRPGSAEVLELDINPDLLQAGKAPDGSGTAWNLDLGSGVAARLVPEQGAAEPRYDIYEGLLAETGYGLPIKIRQIAYFGLLPCPAATSGLDHRKIEVLSVDRDTGGWMETPPPRDAIGKHIIGFVRLREDGGRRAEFLFFYSVFRDRLPRSLD
jgi:hypothetical protein